MTAGTPARFLSKSPRDEADDDALDQIEGALRAIADPGKPIDTGSGMGSRDLWVTVGGIEFFIEIKLSNNENRTRRAQ